jgi:hypothetical protein
MTSFNPSSRRGARSAPSSRSKVRLEALEPRLMLRGTPLGQYTEAVYQELLERSAEDGGWNYWSEALASGVSHREVATSLTRSHEYRAQLASEYVSKYLGRSITSAESGQYVHFLDQGSPQGLQGNLLGSAEYFQRQGSANDPFVRALYRDVLDRTPATSEVSYWTAALATIDRNSVAQSFLRSQEHAQAQVEVWYQEYLGRAADAGGLSYWSQQVTKGIDERGIQAGFLGSPEFRARVEFAGLATPGEAGGHVESTFTWGGRTSLANELGWYVADDLSGRVNGILPGQSAFLQAVLSSATRQVIFSQTSFPFGGEPAEPPLTESKSVSLPAARYLGLYLVQNDTAEHVLSQLPDERSGAASKVFFANSLSNPRREQHVKFRSASLTRSLPLSLE